MVDEHYPHDEQGLMNRLDQALPPGTLEVGEFDGDPLVEAARQLARGPRPELSRVAQDHIEQQVRARAAAVLQTDRATSPGAGAPTSPARTSGPGQPIRRTSRARLRAVTRTLRTIAAALLALILFTSGMAVASANTLPGDDLYQVKTIFEELQLTLVSNDHEASLRVDLAERRLDEFEQLVKEREEINTQVLVESSAQLNRALTLLEQGHGSRTELDPRIANLSYRQATLIQYAGALAPPEEYASLALVADWNNLLIGRVLSGGVVEYSNPVVASIRHTTFSLSAENAQPTEQPAPDATPESDATEEQSMIVPPEMVLHIVGRL